MDISESRRQELLRGAYELVKANWEEKRQTWLGYRYAMWCALGMLYSDSREIRDFANEMLVCDLPIPERCTFAPSLCMQLMVKHSDRLSPEAYAKVRNYWDAHREEPLQHSLDFVGVNDNFPCKSTYTALVGGEFLGDEEMIRIGKERLRFLYRMLHRRDMLSEYTSRCYTGMSLYHIASIATDVKDPEMREMALYCEEKIWQDMAEHYFAPMKAMAGPYSRAYEHATVADAIDCDSVHYLLLFDLHKMEEFAPFCGVEQLENDARICWYLSAHYHFPERLLDTMFHKQYPYEIDRTAEIAPCRYHFAADARSKRDEEMDCADEYPAAVSFNTTYMEESFAVGSALRPFHAAAFPESHFVLYPKNGQPRSVFSRYIINDKIVGQPNDNTWLNVEEPPTLIDEGRKLCIQDGNTSLVAYKPTYFHHDAVTQMKASVIVSTRGDQLDAVWADGCLRAGGFTLDAPKPVFIADADVYMAFLPLEITDHGRKHAVEFRYVNGYAELSWFNYDGPVRSFRKNDMLLTANGFVSVFADRKNFDSFEAFVAAYSSYSLDDHTRSYVHTRGAYVRTIHFENARSCFDFEFSPMSEGIRYAYTKNKTIV